MVGRTDIVLPLIILSRLNFSGNQKLICRRVKFLSIPPPLSSEARNLDVPGRAKVETLSPLSFRFSRCHFEAKREILSFR
jgi:hypothetical protein